MSGKRTFMQTEIMDAATAAANHNLRVIMRSNGEMEFIPANHKGGLDADDNNEPPTKLDDWRRQKRAGKTNGRP